MPRPSPGSIHLVSKEHTENDWGRRTDLKDTFAASMELHTEANVTGLIGAGELTQQSCQDGTGQCLLARQIKTCTDTTLFNFHQAKMG